MAKKKRRAAFVPPFSSDKFKGLPKKATRRTYINKKGVKVTYYINEKGKRVSRDIWEKVKTQVRVKKKTGRRKKPMIFTPGSFHHKSALAFIKNKMFEEDYVVSIGKRVFDKLGSFDLFREFKRMYEDYFDSVSGSGQSPDILYRISYDKANLIIYLKKKEIFFNPPPGPLFFLSDYFNF